MRMDKTRLVKTLQDLIRIPSVKDSLEVSRWVKNEMEGIGFMVWSDEDGNLIAEIGKGPGFLLNAHMDTVEPGDGWEHDPFGGEVKSGKIYGRGASDCKAGLASMIEIARLLAKEKLNKRVVFTFTAFEEGYGLERNGVYNIIPRLEGIEKGLILEPTASGKNISVAIGCRGHMNYRLEILGRKGHSAYVPVSDNPVYKFPKLIEALDDLPKPKMMIKSLGVEISDRTTVTEIWSKEGANIFPGKCEVTIDRRALPEEKEGDFYPKLEALCRRTFGKDFRLEQKEAAQGYLFEDDDFLELCKKSIASIGCKADAKFELARIDGSILYNFARIGTFMMGPGDITQAHNRDEYCDVEGLCNAASAVLEVIREWDRT